MYAYFHATEQDLTTFRARYISRSSPKRLRCTDSLRLRCAPVGSRFLLERRTSLYHIVSILAHAIVSCFPSNSENHVSWSQDIAWVHLLWTQFDSPRVPVHYLSVLETTSFLHPSSAPQSCLGELLQHGRVVIKLIGRG